MPLAFLLILAQVGGGLGQTPNDVVQDAGRIGLELTRRAGALVVTKVEQGSSVETAGIKIGDQVLRIDLEATSSMGESTANASLRGSFGTRVTLMVLPRGAMLPRSVDVKRDIHVYLAPGGGIGREKNENADTEVHARPVIETSLAKLEISRGDETAIRMSLERGAPDVATCVGVNQALLPNTVDDLGVTFTLRKESISVKTDPAASELSSCLGTKAAGWKLPSPKKPLVITTHWAIQRK